VVHPTTHLVTREIGRETKPRAGSSEPDGALYQTMPGGGARDWSVPAFGLAPMDFGFADE
jgi:hypothetical protein